VYKVCKLESYNLRTNWSLCFCATSTDSAIVFFTFYKLHNSPGRVIAVDPNALFDIIKITCIFISFYKSVVFL